jgi:hypothetical protein
MSISTYACKELSNRNYQIRNILSFFTTLFAALGIALYNFVDYENLTLKTGEFAFLSDYVFYIMIAFNIINQLAIRKFTKSNETNLVYMSMTNFLFLALIPIVSVIAIDLFNFDNTLNTKYNSISETLLVSAGLGFLSYLFFIDKIKSKSLKRIDLMILVLISSSFAFVLMNKLMQVYSAPSVYISSMMINLIVWLLLTHKKKEHKLVKKSDIWLFVVFSLQYIIYSYINILIVDLLPTEHIAIIRSVFGVLVALSFDYFLRKKKNMTIKDSIVLILIISFFFYLDY